MNKIFTFSLAALLGTERVCLSGVSRQGRCGGSVYGTEFYRGFRVVQGKNG